MASYTDQEWILILSGTVAFILFFGAVFCIVFALVRGLRVQNERPRSVRNKKKKPRKLCRRHSMEEKGRIVIARAQDFTGTTQTESLTNVSTDESHSSADATKNEGMLLSHPITPNVSSTDLERNEKKTGRYTMKQEKTVVFNVQDECNESEVAIEMPQEPVSTPESKSESFTQSPICEAFGNDDALPAQPVQVNALPESNDESVVVPESFRSTRKPKLPGYVPPLKLFTPPRSVTPQRFPPVVRPWAPQRHSRPSFFARGSNWASSSRPVIKRSDQPVNNHPFAE